MGIAMGWPRRSASVGTVGYRGATIARAAALEFGADGATATTRTAV